MKAWVCNLVTLTACLFFTLLSPGLAQYIPAGTMTPPITLTSPSAAVVPLTIKGAASQSGNLLNLTNSADAVQASVSSGGALYVPQINDSNGNEQIKFTATGSAVNEITVTNAATGNGPTISATGGDSNININLTPKGTGAVVNSGGYTCTGVLPSLVNNAVQIGTFTQNGQENGTIILSRNGGTYCRIRMDGYDNNLDIDSPVAIGGRLSLGNNYLTNVTTLTQSGAHNYNGTVTTINGSVAGTIKWSMPEQGTGYKKFVAVVSGYNDASGVTITFPTAFANTPNYFLSTGATVTVTSTSTTQIVIPISAGTSGTIIVEGI